MGYKPLTRKISDAIYLMLARSKTHLSVPLWSLLVIPAVYMFQILFLTFATNLPVRLILGFTLIASAAMEEVIKSISIVVLARHDKAGSWRDLTGLSFLSALGFLVGEKLLVLISISMVSEAPVAGALFGVGLLLFIPLIAHFVFTSIVVLTHTKLKFPYPLAVAAGTIVHFFYNVYVLRGGF